MYSLQIPMDFAKITVKFDFQSPGFLNLFFSIVL